MSNNSWMLEEERLKNAKAWEVNARRPLAEAAKAALKDAVEAADRAHEEYERLRELVRVLQFAESAAAKETP